jgi:biopolymer transport protein ExbB/TolQ
MDSFIGISKARTNLVVVAPGIAEAPLATAPALVIRDVLARLKREIRNAADRPGF